MTSGEQAESEGSAQGSVGWEESGPPPARGPAARDSGRDGRDGFEDDFLLGTPLAGRIVTVAFVVGIAVTVGIVMVSTAAMAVTAAVGAVTAYIVAYEDNWIAAVRRRRVRRRHVPVAHDWGRQRWRGRSWTEGGVGHRAA